MPPSGSTDTTSPPLQARVLLYSDDYTTRDAVRAAVGTSPAADVRIDSWVECATALAVHEALASGLAADYSVLILDGEAAPEGGMGLCRDLKNSIADCPPVVLLTGRPQDGWLATWSMADAAVPAPINPVALSSAVVTWIRQRATGQPTAATSAVLEHADALH